ncbi:MAG: L,D-transpeptidase [Desulfarculaceae bacterium]|nr:L,D-transpeptidase [Desulfarculaceae bacterium]
MAPLDSQGVPVVWCYHGQAPDTRLVVVDKSRQRLLVLRYLGKLGLEYEYPCASGEKPGPKSVALDERTPEGVYFITHRYKDRKVTIFGDRALHLNYPNPQDKAQGRKGDGIYIHGTNKSYKPRSSNGCLVMANQDLAMVEPLLDEQYTPVIVVERMALPSPELQAAACEYLRTVRLDELLSQAGSAPTSLDLVKANGAKHDLSGLAADLQRLGPGVKAHTKGLALFGAKGQWVLLANQYLTGPKKKGKSRGVALTRRFYLSGAGPGHLKLVQVQWLVPNLAQARLLASWAPPKQAPVAVAKAAPVDSQAQIKAMLNAWLAAWQHKRLKTYMSFYARDFNSGGKNRRQWRKHKAYLNRVYKRISVRAEDVRISVAGDKAKVTFVQHYRSDWHRDLGLKTLELVRHKGRWLIRGEQWEKLPASASPAKRG